ncbi:MAG: mechanosensitive ion channel family protein [Chitinophagales bacterium]
MSRLFFLFAFIFISSNGIFAQEEINPEANTSSPYHTIFTHLYYLQDDTYTPEKSAMTIYAPEASEREKIAYAIQLKKVLDGNGIYIDMNLIPKNANYIDTTREQSIFILSAKEERVYLEKIGDEWLYSANTIIHLDEMYSEVFPFGADFLSNLLPQKIGAKQFLGLKLWQWLGMLIGLLASFIFYWIVKWIVAYIIRLISKVKIIEKHNPIHLIEKIAVAFSLLSTTIFINKFIAVLLLPIKLSQYIIIASHLLIIIFTAMLVMRIIGLGLHYVEKVVAKSETKMDDQLLPIVSKMLKILIGAIALTYCLRELNVDVTAIFAGLSVGALALALAAQDTVKNLIGSITIFIDHPFEIGDYILASGIEGEVEEVGMRATRIRTPHQSLAYIPNGELSNVPIDNYGLRVYRRWRTELGIEYGTPVEKIEIFVKEVELIFNEYEHTLNNKTIIRLNSLGASSLNIMVSVFFNVDSWGKELDCKQEMLLAILKKAEEMNIGFAFPTQTLHIQQ